MAVPYFMIVPYWEVALPQTGINIWQMSLRGIFETYNPPNSDTGQMELVPFSKVVYQWRYG